MCGKCTLAVVIGLGTVCGVLSAQPKGTNTGVVSGVVEYSEAARTRAKVLLRDQNDTIFEAVADETGEFRLELPAGEYTLEVRVIGGFVPFYQPKFRLHARDTLSFSIRLEPSRVPGSGAISGVVKDTQKAAIPAAKIQVKNLTGKSFETVANEAGEFWLDVPEGVYSLEIGGVRGFRPFKRPGLRVSAGDKLRVPVQLEVGYIACDPVDLGIVGEGVTQYEEPEPTCDPVQKILAVDENGSRELMLEYWGRTGTGAIRVYTGATLFCDIYVVKADRIVYDSGEKRASAEGKVVVEDGHSTERVKSAVVRWPECRPEVVE